MPELPRPCENSPLPWSRTYETDIRDANGDPVAICIEAEDAVAIIAMANSSSHHRALLDLAREWVDLWDGGYSPQLLRDHTDKCRAILARVGGASS